MSDYGVPLREPHVRDAVPALDAVLVGRLGLTTDRCRRIHLIAARLLVGAVMAQLTLGVISLRIHGWTGPLVGLLSLIVALAAVRGRFTPSTVGLSIASAVLVGLQGVFIALADISSVFGIVHLIEGLIIFGLAIVIAIESEDEVQTETRGKPFTP